MGALVRAHDWTTTPLGAPEQWPQSLQTAVSTCLHCSFPILIWWGPDLIKIYNDAYRPMLGRKHPQALGQRGEDCWREIWHIIGPMLRRVLEKGEAAPANELLLMLERSGYPEECYFSFSYSPIYDETGVGGVFCPVIEMTDKVIGARRLETLRNMAALPRAESIEEACRQAAQVLSANAYDIPFGLLYLLDDDKGMARLAATAGLRIGEIEAPAEMDLANAPRWPLMQAIEAPAIIQLEDRDLPTGAWSQHPTLAYLAPVLLPGSQRAAAILVMGVSPHKELDQAYRSFFDLVAAHVGSGLADTLAYESERQRAEALAELDRAKTTFFSNISHELRTPLTLMLGPLEDMLPTAHSDPSSIDRDQLEIVYRNGLRLLKLTNTLLDFARIEAGRAQATYEPADLSALTAELASVFRSAIEKAGLELIVDCPPLSEQAFIDRDMWEKIVLNLLSNAFKFTFAGTIEVKLRETPRHFELTVADTGIGVPADQVSKVFERFHRVMGAHGRTHEGSGIGLALVHELVKLHGGSASVESEYGRGSTFQVTIPRGQKHLPAEQIGKPKTQATTALGAGPFLEEALRWLPDAEEQQSPAGALAVHSPAKKPSETAKARILVADDNADMRDYLRRLLVEQYEVETVADGEAALNAVARCMPDLVLADIMMPRLDGLELLARLRGNPDTRTMPIILLSARAGEEAREEGLSEGADEYLIKPFSARDLLATVGANIKTAGIRRETEHVLRQSADDLKEAQRVARVGSWQWDPVTDQTIGSDELRHIYGLQPGDPIPGFKQQDGTFYPHESWVKLNAAVQRALQTGKGYELELKALRNGHEIWIATRGEVLRDPAGQPIGLRGTVQDVTDRNRAEEALARQRRLYEAVLTTTPDLVYIFDHDHRFIYANEGLLRMWGKSWDEAIGKNCHELGYEPWHAEMHDREIEQVIATKQPIRGQVPFTGTFGRRIYDYIFTPVLNASGEVEAVAGTTRDVTELRAAEEALRQRTEQLQTLINRAPLGVYLVDADFQIRTVNPIAAPVFESVAGGPIGRDFDQVIHSLWPKDYADEVVAIFRHTLATGEPYVMAERVETRLDSGETEYYEWRVDRIVQPEGRFGVVCYFREVSSQVQARRTQQLLIDELNHRVKNTLASVQAIVHHTLRSTKSPIDFAASFTGRIQSMSRVHSLLTSAAWKGADLHDVIRDQLLLGPIDDSQLTIGGPAVLLEPQIAQHLAMMLHELATNSVKYGALKDSRGAVTISWAVAGQTLTLLWLERCAVRISGPIKRGFGSTLIEQSARGSGGDARMSMNSDGVSWHITIPLPRRGNKQGTIRQVNAGPESQEEPSDQPSSAALAGKRLLVVEDEPLVALDIAAKLTDAGIEVAGPASSAEEALRIIEATSLDGALLDANLHGHPVDSIAEALAQRGVPLVFVTGYGRQSLPRAFASAALLPKPFSNEQLIEALIQLTARPAAVSAKAS